MGLIQDQPEDLPTTDSLAGVSDPDTELSGERAEIYLSGAHVATLENAPGGLGRVTLMVELEVTEEATRFTEDGHEVPIRRCRRIGDMWIPGETRPPSKEEIKAMQQAAKLKAATEKAERAAAEAAEQEHNEPPMFDEDGDPLPVDDGVVDAVIVEDDEYDQDTHPPLSVVDSPKFSDGDK